MAHVRQLGRVMVPVSDQDDAIRFYTETLGFALSADVPFGESDRWVEVLPPSSGAALALVPPRGRPVAIRPSRSKRAMRAPTTPSSGISVDVDGELMGGDGTVPLVFFFRDHDRNDLLILESDS